MIASEPPATERWALTAPESLVLRDGPKAKPAEVIKVAFIELVTRRVLRLVEVETRNRRGTVKSEIVIGAGSSPAPAEGPLAPVAKVALETKARTYPDGTVGLPVPDFARAFVMAYKRVPQGYIEQAVLPALEARGLFISRQDRFLRIFRHTTWTRTPDGERALARLAELTTTAEREAEAWSEREPRRLAGFLATAGGAALLVPTAYPLFEDFSRRLRVQPDDAAIVPIIAATTATSPESEPPEQGLDISGFDLGGVDFSAIALDFSGFAGLEGAFASIDAGISAGVSSADGGAGGGGGGDGGSSSS